MPLWSFYVVAMMILLVSLYLRTRYAFGGEILLLPPLIVFILAKTLGGVPLVSPLLGYAPLSAFGRASYSMYLWQQLATYPFIGAGPGFYILALGTCAAVTMGLYQGLERPLMTLGRSLDGKIRSGNRLAV